MMKPSKIAVEVAAKFLQSQGEHTPRSLLKAVGEAQTSLHREIGYGPPKDASVEEQKSFSRIVRAVKAMYEESERIRLELDEWVINYEETRGIPWTPE